MGTPASASARLGWAVPVGLDSSLPLRVGNPPGLPIRAVRQLDWISQSRSGWRVAQAPGWGAGAATERSWHQDFWSP